MIEGFCNENSELFQVHTKNKQDIWTKSNVDTFSLRIFLTWTKSFFCLAIMDVFVFISDLNNRVCLYILEHRKLLLVSLKLRNFGAKPSRRHMVRSSNTASVLQIWETSLENVHTCCTVQLRTSYEWYSLLTDQMEITNSKLIKIPVTKLWQLF